MSTGSRPTSAISPQLDCGKCPVCRQAFSDPRILPCVHTVCLKCIEQTTSEDDVIAACPVCEIVFPVPSGGGLGGLPVNVFAQRRGLLETIPRINHAIRTGPTTCEKCSSAEVESSVSDGDPKVVGVYCAECDKVLCGECGIDHSKDLTSRFHVLIRLDEKNNSPGDFVKDIETRCRKHEEEFMRLYCSKCEDAICMKCFSEEHQTHGCSEIETVEMKLRVKMDEELNALDAYVDEHRDFNGELQVEEDNADNHVDELERSIHERADKLKRRIDRDEEKLSTKLALGKKWKENKMIEMKEDWKRHFSSVDYMRSYLNELRKNGTATDICVQRKALRHKMEELLRFDSGDALSMLHAYNIVFVPSTSGDEADNVVGEIEMKLEIGEKHPTDSNMSESSKTEDQLLDLAQCPHCFNVFTDPRCLPCFHTFCLKCVESQTKSNEDGATITKCPLCTREFHETVADELPPNSFVEKLARIVEFKSDNVKKLSLCEECSDRADRDDDDDNDLVDDPGNDPGNDLDDDPGSVNDSRLAVAYCADCKVKLCEVCAERHLSSPDQHHHVCLKFGEVESSDSPMNLVEAFCRLHSGQTVDMFCFYCQEAFCKMCLDQSHKGHRCTEVGKVDDKFRGEVAVSAGELGREVELCRKQNSEWKKTTEAITNEVTKAIQNINDQADRMRQRIDEDEKKIIDEVDLIRSERAVNIDGAIEKLQQHTTHVEILRKYAEELRKKGSVVDIARDAHAVQRSTLELLKFDCGEDSFKNLAFSNFTFIPSNSLNPLEAETAKNIMGAVDIKWTSKVSDPRSVSTTTRSSRSKRLSQYPAVTQCWICKDTYTDPRSLQCLHTFCYKCFVSVFDDRAENSIACPLCKKTHPVSGSGPSSLPKNAFVRKLIQQLEMDRVGDELSLCEQCIVTDEEDGSVAVNKAVGYCIDCKLRLCNGCKYVHGRSQGNRSHTVVRINRGDEEPDVVIEDFCPDHEDEKLTNYCETCKSVICNSCATTTHVRHRHTDLTQGGKEFQQHITDSINSLLGERDKCAKLLESLEVVKDEVARKERDVEKVVRDEAEQLRCRVEQDRSIFLGILSANKTRRITNIERGITELTTHISLAERLQLYADALRRSGTAVDVARQHHQVLQSKDDLVSYDLEGPPIELGAINVTYTASNALTNADRNVVGDIIRKDVRRTSNRSLSTDDRSIQGLAILGQELALVRYPTKQHIEIYDLVKLDLRERFAMKDLSDNSFGIASCFTNGCYYVGDYRNKLVHCVERSPGGTSALTLTRTSRKWKVFSPPTGLSVNSAHNIIVTYFKESFVDEYTTYGDNVRRIKIHRDLIGPWHTIQLRQSVIGRGVEFVICHGDYRDPLNRVCLIDDRGTTLLSHGNSPGSGPGQLRVPISLAVVGSENPILVADHENNRILAFQSLLSSVRDLQLLVRSPSSVCIDETSNRLFVGEGTGRLLVFNDVLDLTTTHGARR